MLPDILAFVKKRALKTRRYEIGNRHFPINGFSYLRVLRARIGKASTIRRILRRSGHWFHGVAARTRLRSASATAPTGAPVADSLPPHTRQRPRSPWSLPSASPCRRPRVWSTPPPRRDAGNRGGPVIGVEHPHIGFAIRLVPPAAVRRAGALPRLRGLPAEFRRKHEMHVLLNGLHGGYIGEALCAQDLDDARDQFVRHGCARRDADRLNPVEP